MKRNWIKCSDRLPEKEMYYTVKFKDGTTDRIPFRIRPRQSIHGFMTENEVIEWK